MKACELRDSFGLDNLQLVELPEPELGPGQVRLAMKAASLNYRDLLMVKGHYNPRQPLPLVPLSDGVGIVEAVGEAVTRVKVGDRVAGTFFQGWQSRPIPPQKAILKQTLGGPLPGMLAEKRVLGEEGVVLVPNYLSDEEAACLPCAALTAWSALVGQGGLKAGDSLLVQGTGGVALFALQIGLMMGAQVIITSSSDEKLARAKELGAHHGINYKQYPAWSKEVRKIVPEGVSHVLEVGGAETLTQSMKSVHPGAQISVIGVLSGVQSELNILPVLMQNLRLQGVLVGSRREFEDMNQAFAQHQVQPVVDRVYALDEAPQAFADLGKGAHFGKLVVRF